MPVSTKSLQHEILIAASKWLEVPAIWTLDLDMIWESDDPGNNDSMTDAEIETWMRENGYDSIKIHLYAEAGANFGDTYELTGTFADITGYVNDWYDHDEEHSGKYGSYYLDDIEVWPGY